MKKYQISGAIGFDVMPETVKAIINEAAGEEIEISLTSPGGYLYHALIIHDMIRNYSGGKTVRIVGYVASAASFLVTAFDRAIASETSILMIHNAMSCVCGDHRVMDKEAKELRSLSAILNAAYVKASGKTQKEIATLMDVETYFYGEEIAKAGFGEYAESGTTPEPKDAAVATARAAIASLKLADDGDIRKAYEYANKSDTFNAEAVRALIAKGSIEKKDFACTDNDEIILLGAHPVGKNGVIYRSALRAAASKAGQYGKTSLSAVAGDLLTLIDNYKPQGGNKVDKKEVLEAVATMKENAQITLPEIAKAMNLQEQLITPEQKAQLDVMNKLKELGVTDPVAAINEMQTKEKANLVTVRKAALDLAFGADPEGKNHLRQYAEKMIPADCVDAKAAKETIKADPVAIRLAGDKADYLSSENFIGKAEADKPVESAIPIFKG